MENKILKIFTFIIVTITALILIFKPELVRTMIPGIGEEIYVTITEDFSLIKRGDDITRIIVALIMPVFAGIMRSISDSDLEGIKLALACTLLPIFAFVISIAGIIILIFLFVILCALPILPVIISYIFCCFLIFSDSLEGGCDCVCDFVRNNCTTD